MTTSTDPGKRASANTVVPDPPVFPEPADSASAGGPHRTRRSVILGALGGAAGLLAGRFGRPEGVAAAAGSPLIVGSQTNDAGTSDTQLVANSNVVTFKLYQQGPGTALMGYTTPATGTTRGVYGRVDSPNGDGVQGRNGGAAGSGAAVRGYGGNNDAVVATTDNGSKVAVRASNSSTSGTAVAVTARTASTNGYAVLASGPDSATSIGVIGIGQTGVEGYTTAVGGNGVWGDADVSSANSYGVYGTAFGLSHGVVGYSDSGYGVYSIGNARVDANLSVVGILAKGGGSFRIDHPLDPANKVLSHSFVESPDMMNVYNGNATLDGAGEAVVEMPAWFEALNRDFRYQLTPIGAFAPLYIKAEIAAGRFSIAGGQPGQRVSWLVTGIRKDAWANQNRIPLEEDKVGAERGRYIHPGAHGKSESMSISALYRRPDATAS